MEQVGNNFCVVLNPDAVLTGMSKGQPRYEPLNDLKKREYERYKSAECELVNAIEGGNLEKITNAAIKVYQECRWIMNMLHPEIFTQFEYRQLFVTVNYDLPEKYQEEMKTRMEFRAVLDHPNVRALSQIILESALTSL